MARSDTLAKITDNDDRLLQIAFDVLASVYFGAAAVLVGQRWPRVWKPVSKALSYSALTGLLSEVKS